MLCPYSGSDNIPGMDACEGCGSALAGLDLPGTGTGFRGKLLNDRIGDLKISPPLVLDPDESVAEAISRMREERCGCVLVEREGELVGIFNERHVLTRVLSKGLDPAATPISQVMSPDPLRFSVDDPPAFAVHCMVDYDFRHLPVLSDGQILGYVSVRSILAYLNDRVIGT